MEKINNEDKVIGVDILKEQNSHWKIKFKKDVVDIAKKTMETKKNHKSCRSRKRKGFKISNTKPGNGKTKRGTHQRKYVVKRSPRNYNPLPRRLLKRLEQFPQ